MLLLYYFVLYIFGFLCFFDENEIFFERWWKIVELVKMLGMEYFFFYLVVIFECKNFFYFFCNILKLIGIFNIAW